MLRPEHIQKINDYNLNIPRYVDTFEAEDSIDLASISAQLIELDKASRATDATIAAFCQELGHCAAVFNGFVRQHQ